MEKLFLWIVLIITGLIMSLNNFIENNSPERKELNKQAIDYFVNKYEADENDITIESSNLTNKVRKTLNYDAKTSELVINYNNIKCTIIYDLTTQSFTDNFKHKSLENDVLVYFKNGFDFLNYNEKVKKVEYDVHVPDDCDEYDGNMYEFLNNLKKPKSSSINIDIYFEKKEDAIAVAKDTLYNLVKVSNGCPIKYLILYKEEIQDTRPRSKTWFSFYGNYDGIGHFRTFEDLTYDEYDYENRKTYNGTVADFLNKKISISEFFEE